MGTAIGGGEVGCGTCTDIPTVGMGWPIVCVIGMAVAKGTAVAIGGPGENGCG